MAETIRPQFSNPAASFPEAAFFKGELAASGSSVFPCRIRKAGPSDEVQWPEAVG